MSMADELDQAAEQTRRSSEAGIARIRAQLDGAGSAECDDCGEDIPAARRKAMPSARRCVTCQSKLERRG